MMDGRMERRTADGGNWRGKGGRTVGGGREIIDKVLLWCNGRCF